MTIGIFFGSFNPIHRGHVAIAERFLQEEGLDEVWLSVSPHNPLKEKDSLLRTELRVCMTELAVKSNPLMKVLDFEKDMPQPSFTYEALLELQRQHPEHRFVLLIGGDNCGVFDQWRNYDAILNDFSVWAYPRDIDKIDTDLSQRMRIIDAPFLDFASTDIREAIVGGKIPEGLPAGVFEFIIDNKLYRVSNKSRL